MPAFRLRWLLPAILLYGSSPVLPSQVRPGIFGYQVQGQNGIAGEFCHQFDCTPRTIAVNAGETLTLRVNAPYQVLYAIGASFSATSCISLPFANNALILDQPVLTLSVGLVSTPSPILACWGGTVQVPLAVPPGVPTGLSFATQALADVPSIGGTTPSFSVAVVGAIR